MSCCFMEYDFQNFLLQHQPEEDFYSPKCKCLHRVTLVGLRFFFAVYCIFFMTFDLGISVSETRSAAWFKYFTSWAYISCTLYFLFSFFLSFMEVCQICRKNLTGQQRIRRQRTDPYEVEMKVPAEGRYKFRHTDENGDVGQGRPERVRIDENVREMDYVEPLPNQFKLMWALENIALTTTLAVTVAYWVALRDYDTEVLALDLNTYLAIDRHGIVTLFMLIEFFLNRIPFHILKFIYPLSFGILYLLFHLVNWEITGENIYTLLDWKNHPGHTLMYFVAILIGLIVIHIFLFIIQKCKECCK